MNKWITLLCGVLVAQIAVAVGLHLQREDYAAFQPENQLLSFDTEAVDHIRIDGDADAHVLLSKHDSQWRLPELKDFPADQDNVKRLLDQLASLKKSWPVATTKGAAKRFKVAEASFERKLTLAQGEKTQATLYVGTSPSFRKVHVRLPDEDAIHAAAFNTYDVGVKPEDWIDKAILTHPTQTIRRVEFPDFTLQHQDDKLVVAGLREDEETIQDEAKRLLERIAGLNVRNVLLDGASHAQQDTPAFRYTLELDSGAKQSYVYSKPKDAEHYLLTVSHRAEAFQVDTWVVEQLQDVARDKLIRKKSPTPDAGEEKTSTQSQ
jgi:hypothetical protein